MFRKDKKPKQEYLNCLFNDGGLGDHIARCSALKYIRDNLSHVTMYVYVPDFFIPLARNLVPGMAIRPFSSKDYYMVID